MASEERIDPLRAVRLGMFLKRPPAGALLATRESSMCPRGPIVIWVAKGTLKLSVCWREIERHGALS